MGDFRLLITGSRDWADFRLLAREMGSVLRDSGTDRWGAVVVHGNARGADKMADAWTQRHGIRVERYRARWGAPCRPECKPGHRQPRADGSTYCPAAGDYRNEEMLATGPALVMAFLMPCAKPGCREPGPHFSHGGSHCADLAEKSGIEVRRFTSTEGGD